MFIEEIGTERHPILGNQKLSLKIGEKIVKTAIFAGENGCGKSTLMQMIYEICSLKVPKLREGEKRFISFKLNLNELNSLRYPDDHSRKLLSSCSEKYPITLGFDASLGKGENSFYISFKTKGGKTIKKKDKNFLRSKNSIRMLGAIYMDHDLHRVRKLKHKTAKEKNYPWKGRKSSDGEGYSTKEGLISAWSHTKESIKVERDIIRTTELLFDKNEFRKRLSDQNIKDIFPINSAIRNLGANLEIMEADSRKKTLTIQKNSSIFDFDHLSSGEKQILGITSFLTYDIGASEGCVVLVDEPENNLHPVWQLKIKQYLHDLFSNQRQIFVVTHSPFLIHEKSNPFKEKVYILKRLDGKISISDQGDFYAANEKQLVNDAFNVSKFESDIRSEDVVFVEGETDEIYLNLVKAHFFQKSTVKIKWIGRYDASGAKFTGSSALRKAQDFLTYNPEITNGKTVILYDCDEQIIPGSTDRLLVTKNTTRTRAVYQKGIENGLCCPPDFPYDNFFDECSKVDGYGAKTTVRKLNKVKLAKYISELSEEEIKVILKDLAEDFLVIINWLNF